MSRPVDFGVESVLMVGGVVDFPDCAVSFLQLVESLHDITVSGFVLALDIVCVRVVNAVFEFVLWMVILEMTIRLSSIFYGLALAT